MPRGAVFTLFETYFMWGTKTGLDVLVTPVLADIDFKHGMVLEPYLFAARLYLLKYEVKLNTHMLSSAKF